MSLPLFLMRGERAVWSGQSGVVPRRETLAQVAWLLVPWSLLAGLLAFFQVMDVPAGGGLVVSLLGLVWLALSVALARLVNHLVSGVLVGNRHLVERSWFTVQRIPLASLRSCRRCTAERLEKGVSREVETHELELTLADGRLVTIGPVVESSELADLLDGICSGAVVPRKLPSLEQGGARPEPASRLLWIRPSHGKIQHGSLVVTPRWLAYFATPLGVAHESRLSALVASSEPVEVIEERLVALAHSPGVGVVRLVERAFYNVRLIGGSWLMLGSPPEDTSARPKPGYRVLTTAPAGPSNEEVIPLEPLTARRVEAFLRLTP